LHGRAVHCLRAPLSQVVWVWIALMLLTLVYAAIEFAKLKKEDQ
jgi:hypothetical protein